jgi:DnaJ like chaperone protein
MSLGKWIAGGLGWAIFGPIGGILGFLAGSALEGSGNNIGENRQQATTRGDFMLSLIVLTASVMKADGKIKKGELDYVKQYFLQAFGRDSAADAVKMLRDILKQEIPVYAVARQIGQNLDNSSKIQLLHYLFGIAKADGHIAQSEIDLIQSISDYMGVFSGDFMSIKAMFVKDVNEAYSILGVSKEATNEEIKKAYKKKAIEFHPDKVAYLGEDVQESAKNKFQKINEAYEIIKKERSII